MTAREKLSAAFILTGMVLLCAEQLAGCIAGVALLGIGALILNVPRRRRPASRRTRRAVRRVSHDLSL